VARACPRCGGLMTVYRDKWARCTQCGHREKLDTE
jgi:ribosomal protein S27AE